MKEIIVFLFLMLNALPLCASEDVFNFSTVSGWEIKIDSTMDNSCFAYTSFKGGSLLRIGFLESHAGIYLIVGNTSWKSIEPNKEYAIKVKFGDETAWNGDASGFTFDPPKEQPFLWINVRDDVETTFTFIDEFMKESNVRFFYKGKQIENLSLKGSYKVGEELIRCQEAVNDALNDPFSEKKEFESEDGKKKELIQADPFSL